MNWYKTYQMKNFPKINVVGLMEFCSKLSDMKMFNTISIRDSERNSGKQYRNMYRMIDEENLPNILVVVFDDLWHEEHRSHGTLPEVNHVSEILQWSKQKWEENHKDFYVHCTGGVSRSASVAALINAMFQGKDFALKEIDPKYHSPNPRILEIGENMLNTPGLREEADRIVKEYDQKRRAEGTL